MCRSTRIASVRSGSRTVVSGLLSAALLVACGRGESNLWERRFDPSAITNASATPLTGTWEGEVFSGAVRLAIEPDRVTLALRCDRAGKKVAQGSARVDGGTTGTMILQEDLAGGDAECGFRFVKGDRLSARAGGPGRLDVSFGNASVAKLARIGDSTAK